MRQLVIFVAYISASSQSEAKTRTRLAEMSGFLNQFIDEATQIETNTVIKWIVIPVPSNQETKIECIYPAVGMNNDILDKLGLLEETKTIKL